MRGFVGHVWVAILAVGLSQGRRCTAHVHHVVGEDRGWETSTNAGEWSARKIFRVGDKLWFAYSAAMEGVVEVGSREEFDACDLSNPIKMYSDGLDKVELDREGIRYFASSRTDSCKNGLKLHLHVQPFTGVADLQEEEDEDDTVAAAGPIPSASSLVRATSGILGFALPLLCFLMTRI